MGDEEGIDAISIRRIAGELGVTPMALYRYVESKEALLEAVADLAFDVPEAARVQVALVRFIISLVAFEVGLLPELSDEERLQKARRFRFELESLPAAEYPNLIEAAPYLAATHDPERNFTQALELLRAGIESQLS